MIEAFRQLISPWDLVLILVVTAMGTLLAYFPDPRLKAFLVGLPFPFTLSSLSLGKPIDAAHVLGLLVLLFFTNLVRWLHIDLRFPIIPAIVFSAGAYLLLGISLNIVIPRTAQSFWISLAFIFTLGVLLLVLIPRRQEPGHRSPLPMGLKIVSIMGLVVFIVLMKRFLGGFMAMFPLVTTVAAYESRHSLWTLSRQVPIFMVELVPMMSVIWLMQNVLHAGIPLSLVVGWVVFLVVMIPVSYFNKTY